MHAEERKSGNKTTKWVILFLIRQNFYSLHEQMVIFSSITNLKQMGFQVGFSCLAHWPLYSNFDTQCVYYQNSYFVILHSWNVLDVPSTLTHTHFLCRFVFYRRICVRKESNKIFHFLWHYQQLPVKIGSSSAHINGSMYVCASRSTQKKKETPSKQVRDIEFGMKIKTSLLERDLAKVARLTEDIPLSVDIFNRKFFAISCSLLFSKFTHSTKRLSQRAYSTQCSR